MVFTRIVLGGSIRPICAVALSVAITGCGGPRREVTAIPASVAAVGVWHVVAPGQTLWRIAKVYGLALDDLARANGVDDPASLAIGQRLFVPGARALRDVPAYPAPLDGGGAPVRERNADLQWPVADGRILSGYGAARANHRHGGIDIGGQHGQEVHAAESGRVVYSGATLRGYGKTVIIDHGSGLQTLYAHNSALVAHEGERVKRGQMIARVGRTGNASTDHCHFEVRRNDAPVDPVPYLRSRTERTR